ncbi:hypothetical protein [Photobacterium galatheae]|uniref:Lipoprotein n=1 Tax=Photobacterium galatheae TaxID=1654360 RepID=A0A066RVA4_9GAMM|nr:hypothetical protein [Photobacterium galatheae]KDM91308.1 hypothetical protein EA58_12110 [Photobacterium galatheae]MCM0150291.1 hypothetical protein [Photobacterium galatheae]
MKHALLWMLVSPVLLSGCGGSGSGQEDKETVQVIDGYLSNAEVCVDRNNNFVCDTGEALSERTNAKGQVTISESDSKYPLIARLIAGETSDSDHPGYVWRDAELLAGAGNRLVTPFSTLAQLNQQTLTDYAASLNLDPSLITQDYVALKKTNPDAKKVHLYARTITKMLGETLVWNDAQTQKKQIQALKSHIETLENNHVDLDDVDLVVNRKGEVTQSDRIVDLAGYLDGKSLHVSFFNSYAYASFVNRFENGTQYESKLGFSSPYQVSGLNLKSDLIYTDFLYLSDKLAVSFVKPDKDFNPGNYNILSVWSEQAIANGVDTLLTADDFIGQTWYHLRDLASSKDGRGAASKPALTELTFVSQDRVLIQPRGETAFETSWNIVSNHELPNTDPYFQVIRIPFGDISSRPSLADAKGMVLQTLFQHDNMVLVKDFQKLRMDDGEVDAGSSIILTKNKALAEAIYRNWKL